VIASAARAARGVSVMRDSLLDGDGALAMESPSCAPRPSSCVCVCCVLVDVSPLRSSTETAHSRHVTRHRDVLTSRCLVASRRRCLVSSRRRLVATPPMSRLTHSATRAPVDEASEMSTSARTAKSAVHVRRVRRHEER